KRMG
ncbi:bacterial regulatory helix-turn-helix, lysR family protein, partial [Vibrio parahaemolyticus V-223/04]